MAILKTCQSASELRREVSCSLSFSAPEETKTRRDCLPLDALPLRRPPCHLCFSPQIQILIHVSHPRSLLHDVLFLFPQFNLEFLLQLHKVAVVRAADLLKVHGEQLPLRALKAAGAEGNLEAVAEYSRTLTEQKEQLVEVGGGRRKGRGTFCSRDTLIKVFHGQTTLQEIFCEV